MAIETIKSQVILQQAAAAPKMRSADEARSAAVSRTENDRVSTVVTIPNKTETVEVNQEELRRNMEEMVKDLELVHNHQLSFSVDEELGKVIIVVTDPESGEVVRQIPSEEVQHLQRRLREMAAVGERTGFVLSKIA